MAATDLLATYGAFKPSHTEESFLSPDVDPMLESLLPAIDDDPYLYYFKAWREMRFRLEQELPGAIEAQSPGKDVVSSTKELPEQISTIVKAWDA